MPFTDESTERPGNVVVTLERARIVCDENKLCRKTTAYRLQTKVISRRVLFIKTYRWTISSERVF